MNKRNVEKIMRQAKEIKAPERVWDKIKDKPIEAYREEKNNRSFRTVALMATSAVACVLVIVSVIAINQGGSINQPNVAGEQTTNPTSPTAVSTTDSENVQTSNEGTIGSNFLNIASFRVWNHRLYRSNTETVKTERADLGQPYSETYNDVERTIYSIKDVSLNESMVVEIGNVYVQYDFTVNGIYEINGKNYGLIDKCFYFYPEPQKGKLLTTVDGMRVYELVGNDKAVLIDMASVVCAGVDDAESLYVAELIE